MSRRGRQGDRHDVLGLESGLKSLRDSPSFDGTVETLSDDSQPCDHFALIYETRDEQFAAAAPFIRRGLEQNQQCLYIADENSKDDVLDVLRANGIDVDAALASKSLVVKTKRETYLRNGTFDPDEMIAFLAEIVDSASETHDGVRITGEMTWILSEDPLIEDAIEYEGKLNTFLPDVECVALCQYNRDRFSPEFIRDVIRTHPHLIHGGTVSHNAYYIPPEEFFGPEQPANEIDRMLGTLRERTEAKTKLTGHHRFLRDLNEITSDPRRSFEEKLQSLFELGCKRFDLEFGGLARVDPEHDRIEVEAVNGDHENIVPGIELPLSETYCTTVAETKAVESVTDPEAEGYDDRSIYNRFDLHTYLGAYVEIDGGIDRTFFFVSSEQRDEEFSEEESEFHRLMGQWVKTELEREHQEQRQQMLYEVASDPTKSWDEKLQALFDIGCERFDLEFGSLAQIDPAAETFEIEAVSSGTEQVKSGTTLTLSASSESLTTDGFSSENSVSGRSGFGNCLVHEELGAEAYLGTRIEIENGPDRVFFFAADTPRNRGFTATERAFLHLLAQWVTYELKQKQSDQRVSVLNRVLRHNLRNDLNTIVGYVDLLSESDGLSAEQQSAADVVRKTASGLVELSEKARHLNEFLERGDGEMRSMDVTDCVETVCERYETEPTAVTIERSIPDAAFVRADKYLPIAIDNLVENAIVHAESSSPTVCVAVQVLPDEKTVEIRVSDDGPGIPDEELAALDRDEETALEHGSGLGLWLVDWIMESYSGCVSFDESEMGGTEATLTLSTT